MKRAVQVAAVDGEEVPFDGRPGTVRSGRACELEFGLAQADIGRLALQMEHPGQRLELVVELARAHKNVAVHRGSPGAGGGGLREGAKELDQGRDVRGRNRLLRGFRPRRVVHRFTNHRNALQGLRRPSLKSQQEPEPGHPPSRREGGLGFEFGVPREIDDEMPLGHDIVVFGNEERPALGVGVTDTVDSGGDDDHPVVTS